MKPRLSGLVRNANRAACFVVGAWICICSVTVQADEVESPTAAQLEFFETRIRPLLVERCFDCHGADTQEAGLRLDSRSAWLAGGDSGTAVVPGNPAASHVIEAVGYRGSLQMPPDGKLADAEIESLTQWIREGLPWPETVENPASDSADGEPVGDPAARLRAEHWSLQPIVRPDIPAVEQTDWPSRTIDYFILAGLEAADLTPAEAVDKAIFLRRAKFDLLGLPPTYEEIEAFIADDSVESYERLIDRYLASPEYGQRWGRHWLDVARYADTKGYVFTAEPRYPYAYTYRDYVIRAFNEDLPFDQFVVEQLAADQLELGTDKRPLAALGFLTLGRRFDNNVHDIIDDRIDVVTRGLLGLTVSCARCHDHKYDPIPTADYYSLYGVFASSVEPDEKPLISMPDEVQVFEAHQTELTAAESTFETFAQQQHVRITDELRTHATDYLVYIATHEPDAELDQQVRLSLNPGEIKPKIADRWRAWIAARSNDPVFGLWNALAGLPAESFSSDAARILADLETTGKLPAGGEVNPMVRASFAAQPPASMADVAQRYGEALSSALQQWQQLLAEHQQQPVAEGSEPAEPPTALPDAAAEALRQVFFSEESPTVVSREDLPRLLDREASNTYQQHAAAVESLKAAAPEQLSRAMVLVDADTPHEPRIFQRGNPARAGDPVPRQYLRLLSGEDRQPFKQGSGRLELAREITSLDNPLTARVIVNRVWLHHFGQGLVRTPDDFGSRSEPPTHPALLDYLAYTLRSDGWSLKKLHRQIMLSSTYRQSSDLRPACAERDPENCLLWRFNRQRLEFEPLRDALLAVAGRLDCSLEGRAVDLFAPPFTTRRTVYGFVDRQAVAGVLRSFDFTDPDATTAQRPQTVVPQQALFLMNSPFVQEQARHLAERAEAPDDAARVQALYRTALARPASEAETRLALQFIARADDDEQRTAAWHQLAQALLCTNEFSFVD